MHYLVFTCTPCFQQCRHSKLEQDNTSPHVSLQGLFVDDSGVTWGPDPSQLIASVRRRLLTTLISYANPWESAPEAT